MALALSYSPCNPDDEIYNLCLKPTHVSESDMMPLNTQRTEADAVGTLPAAVGLEAKDHSLWAYSLGTFG